VKHDVGSWVCCERAAPARGTWSRYAGRVGRVVQVNAADGEYGVRFTASGTEPTCWFRVDELMAVAKPNDAPDIRTSAGRSTVQEAPGSPLRDGAAA